jgi:hypothetical protein
LDEKAAEFKNTVDEVSSFCIVSQPTFMPKRSFSWTP